MKRTVILAIIGALTAFVVILLARGTFDFRPTQAAPASDSAWYHPSDFALLGKTGRPQLVEFFHPG